MYNPVTRCTNLGGLFARDRSGKNDTACPSDTTGACAVGLFIWLLFLFVVSLCVCHSQIFPPYLFCLKERVRAFLNELDKGRSEWH